MSESKNVIYAQPRINESDCRSAAPSNSNLSCLFIENKLKDEYNAILEQKISDTSTEKQYILNVPHGQSKYFVVPKNITFIEYRQKTDINTNESKKEVLREAVQPISNFTNIVVIDPITIGEDYGCKTVPLLFLSILATVSYAIYMFLQNKQNKAIRLNKCFEQNIKTIEECNALLLENHPLYRKHTFFKLFGGLSLFGLWFLWAYTQGPLNTKPTCKECLKLGNNWQFVQPDEPTVMCTGFGKCDCRAIGNEYLCNKYMDVQGNKYQWNQDYANKTKDGWKCACCIPGTMQCVDVTSEYKPCNVKL